MNALTRDLVILTEKAEESAQTDDSFRQKFHLMPPVGWLNDPNGLCFFKGLYHAFFQYSPFNVHGGVKMWGHCTSSDMTHWDYQGVSLYPDQPFDCHGVYSGAALIENEKMYLYYTGNVKLEDRDDYDYVRTGRQANTVLAESTDGIHFGSKRLIMKNEDYPSDLTLHVRDPKVWMQENKYYMIQGARTQEDVGEALIFESGDRINWTCVNRVTTKKKFGYMWECPDYFEVGGKKLLSVSVQGLDGPEWKERNVYQSGYFTLSGDIRRKYELSEYCLWDYGFDYYAPQSFTAQDGRRIQIAWMGMPDCEEYTNLTIQDGWQHCFTFPREIYSVGDDICQRPVRELEARRGSVKNAAGSMMEKGLKTFDLDISGISQNQFQAVLGEEMILEYKSGRFIMRFVDQVRSSVSGGRGSRYADIIKLENIRIVADASSAEIFINDGRYVFSTRYYPQKYSVCVNAEGASISLYELI